MYVCSATGSYLVHDNFAAATREGCDEKDDVNGELRTLLGAMIQHQQQQVRCLVLDGAGLGTTKALMGRGVEVVVPNPCTATYLTIKEAAAAPEGIPPSASTSIFSSSGNCSSPSTGTGTGVCTAYHGTLRAYIDNLMYGSGSSSGSDSHAGVCSEEDPRLFQLVYADYCCSLYAGECE